MNFVDDRTATAEFSDDEVYRYRLSRRWDDSKPYVAFVMLNPSTADASQLDPTCRRCKTYAQDWGYGCLLVGNLYALRATDPSELYEHSDPVGPRNLEYLREIAEDADFVVAAWGAHAAEVEPRVSREVVAELDVDWHALATTKAGEPRHPLYLDGDLEPRRWSYETGLQTGDS